MTEQNKNPKLRELIKAMDARLEEITAQNDSLEDGGYIINDQRELERKTYEELF